MNFPNYPIIATWYKIRIYQPGLGPRIISFFASDLQAGDLSMQSILCPVIGGVANLPKGFTPYLPGDICLDATGIVSFCTQPGDNQSSKWQPVGSGGYGGDWSPTMTWPKGIIVRVANTMVIGGVTVIAAHYGAIQNVPANAAGSQIPQFPEPQNNRYWNLIAFTAQSTNQNCGSAMVSFVNATNPLLIQQS